jgi:hypothetical protein
VSGHTAATGAPNGPAAQGATPELPPLPQIRLEHPARRFDTPRFPLRSPHRLPVRFRPLVPTHPWPIRRASRSADRLATQPEGPTANRHPLQGPNRIRSCHRRCPPSIVPVPEGTPRDRLGGRQFVSGPARANGSDLPVRSAACRHPEGRRPPANPDPYARNATGSGHLPAALNAYRLAANVRWRLPFPGPRFDRRGQPRRASRSLTETRSGDEGLHGQRSAPSLAG